VQLGLKALQVQQDHEVSKDFKVIQVQKANVEGLDPSVQLDHKE